jgi:glutamyl-tRNA reductase
MVTNIFGETTGRRVHDVFRMASDTVVSDDQDRIGEQATDCPKVAIDRIERRARTLRDEQIERALARIDQCGDLTPEKRVVIAAMADRLTSQLIAQPKAGLRAAAERDDETTVEIALDIFGE